MSSLTIWHWFALAVTLGILDVVLGANFILIACGLAALFTGIILGIIQNLSGEGQCLIFSFGIVISLILWKKYLKKKVSPPSDAPYLNQRARQYLNRYFTLEEDIINGRGRVKVDDTIWRVEGEDLPAGTRIQVVGVDGVILKIKKT